VREKLFKIANELNERLFFGISNAIRQEAEGATLRDVELLVSILEGVLKENN
jgi:hypothetical protein